MPILLSDQELDALYGVTDLQYRLYISGIRRYMDYATGLVGIKRKISYQSLAEETFIEAKQGRKGNGVRSRDQVKRALKALEQAGLIELKSIVTKDKKQLILSCILASTDNSAKNKAALLPPHYAAPQAAPQAATVENQENPINKDVKHELGEKGSPTSRPESRQIKKAKPAPPPISGKHTDDHDHARARGIEENGENKLAPFQNLLGTLGYPFHLVVGNVRTLEMISTWVRAGVTLSEAETGINETNAKLGHRPDTPSYYLKPVLQVHAAVKRINQQAQEVTHASALRDNGKTHRPSYRPSAKDNLFDSYAKRKAAHKPAD